MWLDTTRFHMNNEKTQEEILKELEEARIIREREEEYLRMQSENMNSSFFIIT